MSADRPAERPGARRLPGAAVSLVLAIFALGLGFAVWSLPASAPSAGGAVLRNLERSGLGSPVTAVLMNFRGYDTLLELAVLFIALLGVWTAGTMPPTAVGPPALVLSVLNRVLVPFLALFAGFLLWAGSGAWGGAFQAGAVVAAAGVLIALSGEGVRPDAPPWLARLAIVLGLLAFAGGAAGMAVFGAGLLNYPRGFAKPLILAIEAAAAISIGCTLLGVFLGGRPRASIPGERRPR